ncbi:MAG: protoporphyrinogen oxidase [Verrucomicrobia bacterium]|nr:protoporphyrinogen oxidase [Verrucomicrobiota bacterium]
MRTVGVIGAGITGLTAAFRLSRMGVPVSVYEASGRAGGVIQSAGEDGFLAEFGPNTLLEISPKINEVIRDAGLSPRMMYSDDYAENRYLVRYGRPIAMPSSFGGFLKTDLFSAKTKLSLFKEPFKRRWDNAHEENLAEFVLRRLTREFLDYAIDPLVAGVYAGDPFRLSVKHGFKKLYELEQKYGSLIKGQILGARERKRRAEVSKQEAKKISFDEGLQVLPEGLATALGDKMRFGMKLERIERVDGRWRLTFSGDEGETDIEHDALLLAIPAYRIAELELAGCERTCFSEFGDIIYPPVASVVIGLRRDEVKHPLDGFGMLIPKVENFSILGTLFSSSLFPDRAPKGCVTLTSYVGGMRNPELALRPAAELVEKTMHDLRILLGASGRPVFQNVVLYEKAIPQYVVGYGKYKEMMDSIENQCPGLFFAGHYRDGIALSDSLISGYDIAERIGEFTGGASGAKSQSAVNTENKHE